MSFIVRGYIKFPVTLQFEAKDLSEAALRGATLAKERGAEMHETIRASPGRASASLSGPAVVDLVSVAVEGA